MIVQSNPGHAMTNTETAPQKEAKLIGVLPMPFVSDVAKSIKFYQQLGFVVGRTHEDEGELAWALLQTADGPGATDAGAVGTADESRRAGHDLLPVRREC